jgi:hypothetical protein
VRQALQKIFSMLACICEFVLFARGPVCSDLGTGRRAGGLRVALQAAIATTNDVVLRLTVSTCDLGVLRMDFAAARPMA